MKSLLFVFTLVISLILPSCRKTSRCDERLKKDCICPMIYAPVCGCNGKTYENSCQAECYGIKEYTNGACR